MEWLSENFAQAVVVFMLLIWIGVDLYLGHQFFNRLRAVEIDLEIQSDLSNVFEESAGEAFQDLANQIHTISHEIAELETERNHQAKAIKSLGDQCKQLAAELREKQQEGVWVETISGGKLRTTVCELLTQITDAIDLQVEDPVPPKYVKKKRRGRKKSR